MGNENIQTRCHVYQKLLAIQSELKVPKTGINNYTGRVYCTIEGILEAVKPLLAAYKCLLYFDNDIFTYGDPSTITTSTANQKSGVNEDTSVFMPSNYVQATVHFIDAESGEDIFVKAYAKEDYHKGMSAEQATAAATTYAKKNALYSLLLIDDTIDNGDCNNAPSQNSSYRGQQQQYNNRGNNYQGNNNHQNQQQPQNSAPDMSKWSALMNNSGQKNTQAAPAAPANSAQRTPNNTSARPNNQQPVQNNGKGQPRPNQGQTPPPYAPNMAPPPSVPTSGDKYPF